MIALSAVQSSTRTPFTVLFCSQTLQQCLIQQAHSLIWMPYLKIIASNDYLFLRQTPYFKRQFTQSTKKIAKRELFFKIFLLKYVAYIFVKILCHNKCQIKISNFQVSKKHTLCMRRVQPEDKPQKQLQLKFHVYKLHCNHRLNESLLGSTVCETLIFVCKSSMQSGN